MEELDRYDRQCSANLDDESVARPSTDLQIVSVFHPGTLEKVGETVWY